MEDCKFGREDYYYFVNSGVWVVKGLTQAKVDAIFYLSLTNIVVKR